MLSKTGQSSAQRAPTPKAPPWPTTSSPPPMPAFVPNPPNPPAPSEPTANTATPLAKLQRQAPKPKATPAEPSVVNVVKRAATRRAANAAKSVANKAAKGLFSSFGFGTASGPPMTVKPVGDLQRALNRWGATLALDGKYGPRTASTWQAAAKKNGLPPQISRNGPTTAKVAVQTFEALNVPNIP